MFGCIYFKIILFNNMPSHEQYMYCGIGGAVALIIGIVVLTTMSDNPKAYGIGVGLSVCGALAVVVCGVLCWKSWDVPNIVKPDSLGF